MLYVQSCTLFVCLFVFFISSGKSKTGPSLITMVPLHVHVHVLVCNYTIMYNHVHVDNLIEPWSLLLTIIWILFN